MNRNLAICAALVLLAMGGALIGCEEEDVLAPNVALRGKVTNNSGVLGTIIVEIDYYLRDVADAQGNYEIRVHRDFLVDSLYAWVDKDGNGNWTSGEPHGAYGSAFQVRDQTVSNLNIVIP